GVRDGAQGAPARAPLWAKTQSAEFSLDRYSTLVGMSACRYVFGVDVGCAGSESTGFPVNSTGPVGAPVGEPPVGSSDTANVAVRSVSTSTFAGSGRSGNSSLPTMPSDLGGGARPAISPSS